MKTFVDLVPGHDPICPICVKSPLVAPLFYSCKLFETETLDSWCSFSIQPFHLWQQPWFLRILYLLLYQSATLLIVSRWPSILQATLPILVVHGLPSKTSLSIPILCSSRRFPIELRSCKDYHLRCNLSRVEVSRWPPACWMCHI